MKRPVSVKPSFIFLFLELKNIGKPVVWVFPEVVVCLDCGTAEFAVPEPELRQLAAAAG